MKRAIGTIRQRGFSLIELLVALGIFLIVTGAAFTLLGGSQQRYRTESQVLNSFQEARLGLDQMVRDVNDAGYPPPSFFSAAAPADSASSPFGWSPNYPGTPCQLGTCAPTPGDFDLIIETNPNPLDTTCVPNCVQWIRYQLQLPPQVQVPTLMRGAVFKQPLQDPAAATQPSLVPFVQNVVNTPAQPIFSYTCDTATVPPIPSPPPGPSPPLPCPLARAADNIPANIRDVIITLYVAAPQPDAISGQQRIVVLTGRGRRINPNQYE
jgi:prepilin-type N-terminal cleavage/methylation domain-containing protein